ncbi:SacI homology domain-containing protein, partial [Obelidium mucronatum]
NDSFTVAATKSGRVLIESPTSLLPNALVDYGSIPSSADILSSFQAYAVIGLVNLCCGRYVLIATDRVLAATVQSHKIWQIKAGEAVRVGLQPSMDKLQNHHETLARYSLDQELLKDLLEIVNSGQLYFSPSYDMTHSLQHNNFAYNINPSATLVDDRYFFNRHLMQPLLDLVSPSNRVPWIAKIICGYAGAIDISLQTSPSDAAKIYTVALISRLSTARLGTRYIRRGLDFEGNAANSVEMEQIIRGSAPVVWAQQRDMKYHPSLIIADLEKIEVWAAVEAHLSDLRSQYTGDKSVPNGQDSGRVLCVNLLNDDGPESKLSKAYEKAIQHFPVSKWCRNMNYSNMSVLVGRVNDSLVNRPVPSIAPRSSSSVPPYKASFKVSKIQTGVARVSCLDSLDRTNITSTTNPNPTSSTTTTTNATVSEIAFLETALDSPVSTTRLTNLWSDSGDSISLLYAGTRALRSDVTRTGKRQWISGTLADGINSLTRFYLNNLQDGRKQDAFDLWTGKVAHKDQIWEAFQARAEKRAAWIESPVLVKGKGVVGNVVPGLVIDAVEPLLQETRGFVGEVVDIHVVARLKAVHEFGNRQFGHLGKKVGTGSIRTCGEFLVSAIKIYAPEKVNGLVQFSTAMIALFYIGVFTKLFGVKADAVENRIINELMLD